MADDYSVDHYEVLQISPNAEMETIQRVYRLLAARYHPDNQETGDASRFTAVHDAYTVLSDPERRARYDVAYEQQRQSRWRLVSSGARAENDFEIEHLVRLTLLEVLYTRRRLEPGNPGLSALELEQMMGRPREHLEFTIWFLVQKTFVRRGDDSSLTITAAGAEYLEENYEQNLQRKRLTAGT
jgi:curved DNA-binding protein CbpA